MARTIEGFGRGEAVVGVDAPSGHRLDLLARGRAAARPSSACPTAATSACASATRCCSAAGCRCTRSRRRAAAAPAGSSGSASGSSSSPRSRTSGAYRPDGAGGPTGPVGDAALRYGRLFETYPDAIFCALLGHRPSPKRTPWGLQQRIAALKQQGVVDEDGGLWHRTLDELDACAAAYTAYALAAGARAWVGAPEEGVIVLPVAELPPRYEKLPPPARAALA